MSIQDNLNKFKAFVADDESFLAVLVILVGCGVFEYMLLFQVDSAAPEVASVGEEVVALTPPAVATTTPSYVASRSGAKYHLPWCSGAQRIKPENKIWFASKAEAEAAGYEPAANCKGL